MLSETSLEKGLRLAIPPSLTIRCSDVPNKLYFGTLPIRFFCFSSGLHASAGPRPDVPPAKHPLLYCGVNTTLRLSDMQLVLDRAPPVKHTTPLASTTAAQAKSSPWQPFSAWYNSPTQLHTTALGAVHGLRRALVVEPA